MPDGTFNGVEIAWMATVLALALLARWAIVRHDQQMRRARALLDGEPPPGDMLDETFRGDLDWPRGGR